jgi:hypothetical protein
MLSRNMRYAEKNIMHERNDKTYNILVVNVMGGYHLRETDMGWMVTLEMFIKKCRIMS